jgi:2-polyprenyl-3-methyl-5-hydroxy-6-metoxy-1,4-benzoquinol methylase
VSSTSLVEFRSEQWGLAEIMNEDLELLGEFTGMTPADCLKRLSGYRVEEMAHAWRERTPSTPDEIRNFYSNTDLYLWELLAWNGSAAWKPYLERLEALASLWPADRNPRALDYGCGVGTAALRLSELGYRVTLADVPGHTFDFARARMERHGMEFDVIEVTEDVPALPSEFWHVLVCFDVLEHLPDPAAVTRTLVRSLTRGGGAAVVAAFDATGDEWPHHLADNAATFCGHRWGLFFQSAGTAQVGTPNVYRKLGRKSTLLRKIQYRLWRLTGLHIETLPR